MEKKNGKLQINYDKLDALLQFKVSKRFCADYLGISEDTIDRRLKEDHAKSFSEYRELKGEHTAIKLQQKAIEMALKGNTSLMIFALKNLAKWSDKIDQDIKSGGKSFSLEYVKKNAS